MFWDKKNKKEGLPDLPPLPSNGIQLPPIKPLPTINKNGLPELILPPSPKPSLKEPPIFKSNKTPEKTKLPELPQFKDHEKSEIIMELNSQEHDLETIPSQISHLAIKEQTKKGPIFIKLDKYKFAKESLENIKEKLEEIDLLLKKTREIRTKEESELEYWEKETNELKSQLQRITEDIFEKAE